MGLCYIDHYSGTAYFTDLPVTGEGCVWGDDWDDAPYQYNAGSPYDYTDRIKFEAWLYEPSDSNSHFTVARINSGSVPWLVTPNGDEKLYAGASVEEFKDFVRRHGGTIWIEEL